MKTYPLNEARAEFSKLVERALAGEPQRVTRYGKETVVIVSEDEWRARCRSAPTVGALLAQHARAGHMSESMTDRPWASQLAFTRNLLQILELRETAGALRPSSPEKYVTCLRRCTGAASRGGFRLGNAAGSMSARFAPTSRYCGRASRRERTRGFGAKRRLAMRIEALFPSRDRRQQSNNRGPRPACCSATPQQTACCAAPSNFTKVSLTCLVHAAWPV